MKPTTFCATVVLLNLLILDYTLARYTLTREFPDWELSRLLIGKLDALKRNLPVNVFHAARGKRRDQWNWPREDSADAREEQLFRDSQLVQEFFDTLRQSKLDRWQESKPARVLREN